MSRADEVVVRLTPRQAEAVLDQEVSDGE